MQASTSSGARSPSAEATSELASSRRIGRANRSHTPSIRGPRRTGRATIASTSKSTARPAATAFIAPAVSSQQVDQYYQSHQKDYQVPDEVKVRHILIKVPAGADAKTDAAARQKAEDLLKQIKSGGNFAALATANSDDPGSKVQGGELGMIQRGVTVPEFEKAAFSLQPGQTMPVRTPINKQHIASSRHQASISSALIMRVVIGLRPRTSSKSVRPKSTTTVGTTIRSAS